MLRALCLLVVLLGVARPARASDCIGASQYGADGLVCYDFGQETEVHGEDGGIIASHVVTGQVYVDQGDVMVLAEFVDQRAGAPPTGMGSLWTTELFCGAIGHAVVDCHPVDQAPEPYCFKEPYVAPALLAGQCNSLGFTLHMKPPGRQVHESRDGWSITRHLNEEGTPLLVLSCREASPTERRIEVFNASGGAVYSIALTGGTMDLPAQIEVVRYRAGSGEVRSRQRVDIVDRGTDCRLLTGSLDDEELIARVHRPGDEQNPLTLTRTDRSGRKTTLVHAEGAWREASKWSEELRRRAEGAVPAPLSRAEQIRANRPGFGTGSRLTSGLFLAGGFSLLLMGVLLWWRSRRN